jgi:Protein of unknown function (DUF742)
LYGAKSPRHAARDRTPRRVIPIYAVTSGRTRATGRKLAMESLVTATERACWDRSLESEYRTIVEMAHRPVSLAEIAAALSVPVTVARVLVGDLVGGGYLDVHAPPPAYADGRPTEAVLTRLLAGLRAP